MNSLQLLSPAPSTSSESGDKSATAQDLEERTTCVARCVAARDWAHPVFEQFAEDFQAFVEHSETPVIRSAKEYIEVYKDIAAKHPNYRNEVLSVNADVNEEDGEAMVWLLMRIFGHPDEETVRESVTIAYFSRRDGKWWTTKQRGIRGIPLVS